MMFDKDFQLLGVMDWEQASLGGAMQDLGWWLFFDDFHSRSIGVQRLDGLGTRQETIDFWCDRTGRKAGQLQWYEAFAGYKLAIIMSRGFQIDRPEQPGGNIGNNMFTRMVAEIIGLDQPKDGLSAGIDARLIIVARGGR